MNTRKWMCVILVMAGVVGMAQAQTTNTWANDNLTATTTPTSLNWFNPTQANWTGGTPVSGNVNTIQFFKDTTTRVANTVAATQASVLDYGSAFELGTLTLLGLASSINGATLIMNLSGDALNFSAATGTVNVNALDSSPRTITYNVANNIQLGTASSASTLTLTGNGTSAFNFSGNFTELQTGGGSKLIKGGSSTATISGAITVSGGLEVNGGSLSLTSASNAITGGIALSGSILNCSYASTIDGNNISASGASTLNGSFSLTNATITLNSGANLTFGSNGGSMTISTPVTGDGAISINRVSSSGHTQVLSSTANTFTGTVSFTGGATLSLSINSLADSASLGAGNIRFAVNAGTSAQTFALGSGAIAPLILNNRRIELVAGSAATYSIANNSSQAFTINTDLLVGVNTGSPVLTLGGTGTGLSSFNGKIDNGSAPSLGLTKSGSGTWVLGHTNNTYTGSTKFGGTLIINTLKDYGVASSVGAAASGDIVFDKNLTSILIYVGSGDTANRTIRHEADVSNRNNGSGLYNNGTGALIFSGSVFNTPFVASGNGGRTTTFTLGGSFTGSANEIRGVIQNNDSTSLIAITKSGIGTWILKGDNTFTGATTISGGGTLVLDYTTNSGRKLSNTPATFTLGGGTLVLKGGSYTEVASGTTLSANTGSSISRDGGTSKISLGALTLNLASLSISETNLATTTTLNATGLSNASSILPFGRVTVGPHFGANDGSGNIVPYADYATATTAGGSATTWVNQLTGGGTMAATLSSYALRIVNGGNSDVLDLSDKNLSLFNNSTLLYAGGFDNNYTINGSGFITSASTDQPLIINTYAGTILTVNARIVGRNGNPTGIVKAGDGTLVVGGANDGNISNGICYIQRGVLRLANSAGLGQTTAGTVVQGGAALELTNNITVGAEALTLNGAGISNGGALRNVSGDNTWGGVITLGGDGSRINSESGTLTLTTNIIMTAAQTITFGGAGNITVFSSLFNAIGSVIKDGAGTLGLVISDTTTSKSLNSLVLNGGALELKFTVAPSASLPALNISSLTVSGSSTIKLSATPGLFTSGITYPLLTVTGTVSGTLPNIELTGITGTPKWVGNTLYLVPPPSGTLIFMK
jgi:fibronectin-binding autotransporter adhesin